MEIERESRPLYIAVMNDARIRASFHRKKLRRHHAAPDTLVVDELGLKHGRRRADIAVVNGHLSGFEIKSEQDSLCRLEEQVGAYNAVFDRATVIAGSRHLTNVSKIVPSWWGIMVAVEGRRRAIHFETVRQVAWNPSTDDFAVAQLLWRSEAQEELLKRGVTGQILSQRRSVLYRELIRIVRRQELRSVIRERLKLRTDWRRLAPLSPDDDSSQPCAK